MPEKNKNFFTVRNISPISCRGICGEVKMLLSRRDYRRQLNTPAPGGYEGYGLATTADWHLCRGGRREVHAPKGTGKRVGSIPQYAVEASAGTYRGQSDRRMRDEANFLLRSSVFFRSVRQSGKPDEGAALNVFLIRAFSVRVFFFCSFYVITFRKTVLTCHRIVVL